MGTSLRIRLSASERTGGLTTLSEAVKAASIWEERLSSWTTGSELGALRAAEEGTPVPVSLATVGALGRVWPWIARTGEAFNPGTGAIVDAWQLRDGGRIPAPAELRMALEATAPERFTIDSGRGAVIRHDSRAWIDAGGFGKGLALGDVAAALARAAPRLAIVNFGGQLMVMQDAEVGPIAVDVAHPRERRAKAVRLAITNASVATTGQSERFIEIDGKRFGHVVDPRDGRPVESWGSVTVVAEDPLIADILSTALFVMGPDAAFQWSSDLSDIGVLILEHHETRLELRHNPAMRRWLVDSISAATDVTP